MWGRRLLIREGRVCTKGSGLDALDRLLRKRPPRELRGIDHRAGTGRHEWRGQTVGAGMRLKLSPERAQDQFARVEYATGVGHRNAFTLLEFQRLPHCIDDAGELVRRVLEDTDSQRI